MHVSFQIADRPQQICVRHERKLLRKWQWIPPGFYHYYQDEPVYATLTKPTITTTVTFTEVERYWINHLKIWERDLIKGTRIGAFMYLPVVLWRDNHHDLNILKAEIAKQLEHLKKVIDTHATETKSSFEIE